MAHHNYGIDVSSATTTKEAIVMAKLDWKVEGRELITEEGGFSCPDVRGLFRSDNNGFLSVVSSRYKPLQNEDAFGFVDKLVSEGFARYHRAGATDGGKKVHVIVKMNEERPTTVVKGDVVSWNIVASTSHDKTRATRVNFMGERLVCLNGMTVWFEGSGLNFSHVGSNENKIKAVNDLMNTATKSFSMSLDSYREMAKKKIRDKQFKDYVREVFDTPKEELEMPRAYDVIERIYAVGPGQEMEGVKGTYWGAYNAITNWVEEYRGSKDDNRRLGASLFGGGRVIRDRAFQIAMDA